MNSKRKREDPSIHPPPPGPIDCRFSEEGAPWREYSEQRFRASDSWDEVVDLWNDFYEDLICLPSAGASWTSREVGHHASVFDEDPTAIRNVGRRLAAVSRATGILFDEGQAGDVRLGQRQYLTAFAPADRKDVVRRIVQHVNRFPGLVGFWWVESHADNDDWEEEPPHNEIENLFVTYDPNGASPEVANPSVWRGRPITRLSNLSDGPANLREWLNDELASRLWRSANGFVGIVLIDTLNGRNDLLPVLEEVVNQTQ